MMEARFFESYDSFQNDMVVMPDIQCLTKDYRAPTPNSDGSEVQM